MAGHEARINDALKQLGEEFRLGMVQVAEYRARRRLLIESWGERDITTSPRSLRSPAMTGPSPRTRAAAASPRSMPFVIAAVALLVFAASAWFVFGRGANTAPKPGPALAPVVPLSAEATTVSRAAEDFVSRNVWDGPSINVFLGQWRALGAADRSRIAEEPVMRTLRYRLDQNIQAEMQLITPDSKPEERAQLELLQDFSRALTAATP